MSPAIRVRSLAASLGIALALTSHGCAFRFQKLAPGALGDEASLGAALTGVPSYEAVRTLVLQPKCLNCHTSEAPQLTTYEQVKANLARIEDEVFEQKSMPPSGPLSGTRADLLKRWIQAGAPREGQAADSPAATNPPSLFPEIQRPVTYSAVKTKIFEEKCKDCHYPGNPEGNSDLTTFEGIQSEMGSIFERAVILGDMPPIDPEKGGNPANALTRAERDLLALWFADGFKP